MNWFKSKTHDVVAHEHKGFPSTGEKYKFYLSHILAGYASFDKSQCDLIIAEIIHKCSDCDGLYVVKKTFNLDMMEAINAFLVKEGKRK